MGLFDSVKGALSGALGSISAAALPGLIEKVYPGGLNGLLEQLRQSGLGDKVNSWLGHGANEPITAQDLRNAIGEEHIKMLEEKTGMSADGLLETLAKALPEIVDKHSPQGELEPPPPAA